MSAPTWCGTSQQSVPVPISRARPWATADATRARSASNLLRSPRPMRIARVPSAWVTARRLNSRRASPDASSALSTSPGRSWATSSPSNTPTTIVSAPVASGRSVVASTCTGRTYQCYYDDCLPTTGERDKMPNTVILSAARTPIGKLGGGLSTVDATELGGTAIQGCARARRRRTRPDPARRDGPGAPGRTGPDSLAPGPDQGRDPQGGLLGDDQQGLRLGDPCGLPARQRDPRRRSRRRPGRWDGVDVEVPVPAQGGPVRLPYGRWEGDRRDDQRRAHEPVLGQAHGAGGERGRAPSSN